MRKVKKFAALLLCGALTLSALTGCGGDDGGSSKESSSAPEESSKADLRNHSRELPRRTRSEPRPESCGIW